MTYRCSMRYDDPTMNIGDRMTPKDRFKRAQDLFLRARKLPQTEWERFVIAESEADVGLQREVLSLLAAPESRSPLDVSLGLNLDRLRAAVMSADSAMPATDHPSATDADPSLPVQFEIPEYRLI